MTGFLNRRAYAERCAERGGAWLPEAERVAADIRLFARARKKHGAPYPRWALDYTPGTVR